MLYIMKNKNSKNLKITDIPKGINIVIKNDIQQPTEIKQKKKRRIKKKNIINPAPVPSYMPPPDAGKVGYMKPQYAKSNLNSDIFFPGMPQSLPPPPPPPALPPPPQYPALPAPPPVNNSFNFGDMFRNALTPMQYGYQAQPLFDYNNTQPTIEQLDEDTIKKLEADPTYIQLPDDEKQKLYEKTIEDLAYDTAQNVLKKTPIKINEDTKTNLEARIFSDALLKKMGTQDANKNKTNEKYIEYKLYQDNYLKRLNEMLQFAKEKGDNQKMNDTELRIKLFKKDVKDFMKKKQQNTGGAAGGE